MINPITYVSRHIQDYRLEDIRNELQTALAKASNTPDRLLLSRSSRALVFEYGDLRSEFQRSNIFGRPVLCPGWTEERFYVWTKLQGPTTYPIASRTGGLPQMPREKVAGELFLIPSDHLVHIDNHRENRLLFRRKQVKILLPWFNEVQKNGIKHTVRSSTRAWMYIGTEKWDDQFDWEGKFYRGGVTFDHASIRENHDIPDVGRFYDFTKNDCKKEGDTKCKIMYISGSGLTQEKEPNGSTEQTPVLKAPGPSLQSVTLHTNGETVEFIDDPRVKQQSSAA